jgi:D-sedoheptulose 7-phosphate isomerase
MHPGLLISEVFEDEAKEDSLYEAGLQEHMRLFDLLHWLRGAVETSAEALGRCLSRGGKVMFCGNGGSASDSLHLAAELTGRFRDNRRPLSAIALSADAAAMSCIGNDFGFEHVFERQVVALGRPGDCLVCISTSGSSRNVCLAAQAAAQNGVITIALTGQKGELTRLCDHVVAVPSGVTARIQEAHIFIGHTWCTLIERHLGMA